MTAPAAYTWDFDIVEGKLATAATVADLGGAAYENDPAEPPIGPEMMAAEDANQIENQLAGVNRVIPALILEVTFSAGTPAISNAIAMSSIIVTTWAQAHVTVVDNGNGDTSLTWAAGTIPNPRSKPEAWVTEDVACLQPIAIPNGSIGVRVKTRDSGGTLTDYNFAVRIT